MTRQFKVQIDLENAAFETAPQYEVARVLRELADAVEQQGSEGGGSLRDINGNIVGLAAYINSDESPAELAQLRAKYRLWPCDNGTFDIVDTEDDEVAYCNFGRDNIEASAWTQLLDLKRAEEKIRRGHLVAEVLGLKPGRAGRYDTTWGDKTGLGLFLTVQRIIEDGE